MKPGTPIIAGMILWMVLRLISPAMAADDRTSIGRTTPDANPPMTDIHDIRPPIPVGIDMPWRHLAMLILSVAAILSAIWWWRRRRKQGPIATIVPELPPETVAIRALATISDVRRIDGKTFYFRLSAILRQYVWGRFAVSAPEMTTEEFVPCIARLPLDRELARRLRALCREMDPVKFGDMTTIETQMQTDLALVRDLVRRTTPELDSADRGHATGVSTPSVQGKE